MTKKSADTKSTRLKGNGTLNPHPDKVRDSFFQDSALDFFDPRDLAQVKYEMLRSVEKGAKTVVSAANEFGFSRAAFYKILAEFRIHGIAAFVKKKPGPKASHKISGDLLTFVEESVAEGQPIRSRALAEHIRERFQVKVHPRSIERAVARRAKKKSKG